MDTSLNQGEGKTFGRNEFFNYIKKQTIGETYCHLNQLIKDRSIDKLVNVDELVSLEKELPLFEDSLRLIIIDSLHLKNKVIEILLNQNNYHIKRILKCDWFFKDSLSADTYCRDIIPHVSLSLRYKLLTKLSNTITNENDAEKISDFVRLTYRNQQGELLMPKCSSQYILNYYSGGKTWPTNFVQGSRNFLKICRNHPEVGVTILSTLLNDSNDCSSWIDNYQKAIVFLAGNHPDVFLPFLEKHYSKLSFMKFGKHLSRRLGLKMKEAILSSDNLNMARIFHEKRLFKSLPYGDKVNYIMAKVRTESRGKLKLSAWCSSTYSVTYLLNWIKQCDRLSVVQAAFNQLFNLNYEDHPKVWKSSILELFPPEQRITYAEKYEKWIEESEEEEEDYNFQKPDDPSDYVYLHDFDKAFGKLKKLHSRSPEFYDRQNILSKMVTNCSLNYDPTSLERLLEYVADRHRNDQPRILNSFLNEICQELPLATMTTNTVEKIEELAYYCTFKDESFYFHDIMEKCILYRLDKSLDVEKQIQWVFDLVILSKQYAVVYLNNFNSKQSRVLFFKFYNLIMKWMSDNAEEEEKKEVLFRTILESLLTFNNSNKHNPIRLEDLKGFDAVLKKLIKKEIGDLELENESLHLFEKYWVKIWESRFKRKLFRYTLKQNPNWIIEKFNKILEYLFSYDGERDVRLLVTFLKCISFLGKTAEIKDTILKDFKNGKLESYRRCKALGIYSRMASWEEFEKTIEDYKPKSEKVDLSLDRDFIEIQFTVPRVMRNVRPSWKCLPLMMKFFTGDFLKMVMQSFYPCCYSTGVDLALKTLRGYLDDIEHDKRISIRKDVIRIIGEICTRQELLSFYSKCWDEINHYSIRTVLLRFVSKSFVELPTEEAFKIVEKFIMESDDLVIQAKPDLNRVPDLFINDYVLALWKFSEKEKASFRNNFRRSILNHFNHNNIRFLSKKFCETIIEDNLFRSNSPVNVNNFALYYLICDLETFYEKMHTVLDLLRDRMSDTHAVAGFCSCLKTISWSNPSLMFDIFGVLIKNWPNYPNGTMYFDYLILNYYHIYHEALKLHEEGAGGDKSKEFLFVEFGKRLKKYLSSFENLKDLVFVFVKSLEDFMYEVKRNRISFDAYSAMNELATNPTERSLSLIAILCLPTIDLEDANEEEKKKVFKLIKTLRSHKDEIIEIHIGWKYGTELNEKEETVF